jgi:hypothetical protein
MPGTARPRRTASAPKKAIEQRLIALYERYTLVDHKAGSAAPKPRLAARGRSRGFN